MRLEPLAALELPRDTIAGAVKAPDGAELRFRLEGSMWPGGDNVVCLFGTDDERWAWLNDEICVLVGGRLYLCVNDLAPGVAGLS